MMKSLSAVGKQTFTFSHTKLKKENSLFVFHHASLEMNVQKFAQHYNSTTCTISIYAISSVELANQQRSQKLRMVTNPITLMMGGTIVNVTTALVIFIFSLTTNF